jgi:hypothetical protein
VTLVVLAARERWAGRDGDRPSGGS